MQKILLWICLLGLAVSPATLWASELMQHWSSTERAAVNEGLKRYGLDLMGTPEGKHIRQVYIHTQEPFTAEDGALEMLNAAHVLTKDIEVRLNMAIQPGDLFDEILVIQSVRLLKDQRFRTLVAIATVWPSGAEQGDEVDLLVVSRDVWNLKAEFDFAMAGSVLNNFYFYPMDSNFLGYNKTVGFIVDLRQSGLRLSPRYQDPHLANTWNTFDIQPGIIFSPDGKSYQGVFGNLQIDYPLYAPFVEWGYAVAANFTNDNVYQFKADQVRTLSLQGENGTVELKRQYRIFALEGYGQVTRSFGDLFKNNITWGYGLNLKRASFLQDVEVSAAIKKQFESQVMPQSEVQSFLLFNYEYFWNTFATFYDYNMYALAEIYRTGPNFSVTTNFGLAPILFSSHTFLRVNSKLSYTTEFGNDGFFQLSAEGMLRVQNAAVVDDLVSANIQLASPKILGSFRLVMDAVFQARFQDYDNVQFTLGGNNGLRGVPSNYYQGTKMLRANAELRSGSIPIWITRTGGVIFYDVGSAFDDFSKMDLTQDVGFGLRILVIPFSSSLVRLDFAFPTSGPLAGPQNFIVTMGYGQAF